jgi:hypothetical protein
MATAERRTTGRVCPGCSANETGVYHPPAPWWHEKAVDHRADCPSPDASAIDCYDWDKLAAAGNKPKALRPFGPRREGSPRCQSGSIASGGQREYCTCDTCF